jgi:hypothetical protein
MKTQLRAFLQRRIGKVMKMNKPSSQNSDNDRVCIAKNSVPVKPAIRRRRANQIRRAGDKNIFHAKCGEWRKKSLSPASLKQPRRFICFESQLAFQLSA